MVVCAENIAAMEDVAESFKDLASTPLSTIAEAFEELSKLLKNWKANGSNEDMPLGKFCEACSRISILFSCLGIAFKFAELEYVSKVLFSSPSIKFFYFFFICLLNFKFLNVGFG